jgi:hypothetical protein
MTTTSPPETSTPAEPAGGPTPPADTTATSPTARQLWTRSRALLAALLALVVFGGIYAVMQSDQNHNALDPRSPDAWGSRAVAQLLAGQGVTTKVVTTTDEAAAAAGPDTTLLVAVPDLLTGHQQSVLHKATERSGGRTVLLSPTPASTGTLAPGVDALTTTSVRVRNPGCDLPAARRAGDATTGGIAYTVSAPNADSCYLSGTHPTLVRLPAGNGGDTVVLGAYDPLQNEYLDEQGNASLALQLLGAHPKLVWYLPSLNDTTALNGGQQSFLDLIPSGWNWALLQLFVAALIAALWRARRLGPLVAERLPVAVRAAEATEGRARLYRRARARGRAAEALRAAARHRLAPLVGIPPSQADEPDTVAPAVGALLTDPTIDVRTLLHGPPPPDDAALLRLADELDALERSILAKERYANP